MERQERTHVEGARGAFLGVMARAAKGVVGSRFAKPIAQAALAAAGLVVLAVVGRSASGSGAAIVSASASPMAPSSEVSLLMAPHADAPGGSATAGGGRRDGVGIPGSPLPPPSIAGAPAPGPSEEPRVEPAAHARTASPDDPVVLNAATEADLRRLPGIGAKRADAIVALRSRLGRFHAIEDLLKVRGIGRATLKRLRPMLRLDPAPPDGGAPRAATPASP